MSTERRKLPAASTLIKTGVEREYSQEEIDAIMEDVYGDALAEADKLEAEGKLDPTPTAEDLEAAEWDDAWIQEEELNDVDEGEDAE